MYSRVEGRGGVESRTDRQRQRRWGGDSVSQSWRTLTGSSILCSWCSTRGTDELNDPRYRPCNVILRTINPVLSVFSSCLFPDPRSTIGSGVPINMVGSQSSGVKYGVTSCVIVGFCWFYTSRFLLRGLARRVFIPLSFHPFQCWSTTSLSALLTLQIFKGSIIITTIPKKGSQL
jgi:hypothetical protein